MAPQHAPGESGNVVSGEYKPGRVTTTVTDLVVPAPGLPIQISRSYETV